MKVLQVKGLDSAVLHNTDNMTGKEVAAKFNTSAKSVSSLAFNLAGKGEFYLISEVELNSDEGETTIITMVDPNDSYLRKMYTYPGITSKNVVSHLLQFMKSENLTDNNVYQILSKVVEMPVPQLESTFKTLEYLGININLVLSFSSK